MLKSLKSFLRLWRCFLMKKIWSPPWQGTNLFVRLLQNSRKATNRKKNASTRSFFSKKWTIYLKYQQNQPIPPKTKISGDCKIYVTILKWLIQNDSRINTTKNWKPAIVVGNSVLNDIFGKFHSKLYEPLYITIIIYPWRKLTDMGKFKSTKDIPKEAKQNSCRSQLLEFLNKLSERFKIFLNQF